MKVKLLYISILFTVMCFVNNATHAQISLIFSQKNPYEYNINESSDFMLVNSGNDKVINIDIKINKKNTTIYTSQLRNITCKAGTTQIGNLKLENETFSSSEEFSIVKNNRILPSGNFEICFNIIDPLTGEAENSCSDIIVQSINPPLLIFPANVTTVNNLNPTLIWIGPTNMKGNEGFTYDIKLCEILPNQQMYDAIHQNFALLKLSNLNETQLSYPFNAYRLENGKNYAWQVIAKNKSNYLQETEVWQFKVQLDTFISEKIIFFEGYVIPDKKEAEGSLNIKKEIKVFLRESYPINQLDYKIIDDKNKVQIDDVSKYLIYEGDNRYVFRLGEGAALKNKGNYRLLITNPKNRETYTIRFTYYK